MKKIRKYSMLTLILSGLSIIALIAGHLALTDIYHGGEDLRLEWLVLRITTFVNVAFILSTILTLKEVLKTN